ncbi:MAG: hypothetical protein JXA43_01735 [Candidatus Diapherotrites archaeon]|nr:hypothetical protein [Candidatus Diapherotrites archaeon]
MNAKPIIPTAKPKTRYLGFKIDFKDIINPAEAKIVLDSAIMSYLGQLGFGKAAPQLIEFKDNIGILKVNNDSVNLVRASLALVNKIHNKQGSISVEKVSGSLKALRGTIYKHS